MYDALVKSTEVEGILADIYTASYYMDKINDPRLAVSMILSSQRSIGFVIGHNESDEDLYDKGECLRKLFKYRQRDIKKIIFQHTHAFHVSWDITFYYIDTSVLLENTLVKFIRNRIRDLSGIFFISSLVRISMISLISSLSLKLYNVLQLVGV